MNSIKIHPVKNGFVVIHEDPSKETGGFRFMGEYMVFESLQSLQKYLAEHFKKK